MFKFGFNFEGNDGANSGEGSQIPKEDSNTKDNMEWVSAQEIVIEDLFFKDNIQQREFEELVVGSETLSCIKASAVSHLISITPGVEEHISFAERNHSDLIPSKYEGGLKLWECTLDVAQQLTSSMVSGKVVLDLGCGLGLLGILALKLGAEKVFFQDYNVDVLRCVTIRNVRQNVDQSQLSKCRFFSGDWASFTQMCCCDCDLLVTSETIYNPDNYTKLHDTIKKQLSLGGIALVGAKSYYFGVGGSTKEFEKLVKEKDVFNIETVWTCSQGVKREILRLCHKHVT